MTTALFGSTSATGGALGGMHRDELLSQLSPREREVLALMAEGLSNRAIGEQLTVGLKTVETHVSRVFTKLGLNDDRHGNRRVLAVLTFFGRESMDATEELGRSRRNDAPSPRLGRRLRAYDAG